MLKFLQYNDNDYNMNANNINLKYFIYEKKDNQPIRWFHYYLQNITDHLIPIWKSSIEEVKPYSELSEVVSIIKQLSYRGEGLDINNIKIYAQINTDINIGDKLILNFPCHPYKINDKVECIDISANLQFNCNIIAFKNETHNVTRYIKDQFLKKII